MAKQKNTITEYRNYYLPLHFPVLLLSGDYWKISDIPSGRLHFHNCLEIGICHSENGTMEFGRESLSFHEGDVTVIPRNVPHTTYSAPGTESRWSYLFLDPQELFKNFLPVNWKNYDLSSFVFRGDHYVFSKKRYPRIYHLANHIIDELEQQKPCYQISARGLLLSLYIEIYRTLSTDETVNTAAGYSDKMQEEQLPENSLTIAPALDYIENHYMQPFTIEDLADLCHWSATHFRRVFHEIMGNSPLDFINYTRIMKSCALLRSTDNSILDISETVGFRSVSSFNRCFIKIIQISPREYRKQMQKTDMQASNPSTLEYAGWMFPE